VLNPSRRGNSCIQAVVAGLYFSVTGELVLGYIVGDTYLNENNSITAKTSCSSRTYWEVPDQVDRAD